jgi:hypothetical protein
MTCSWDTCLPAPARKNRIVTGRLCRALGEEKHFMAAALIFREARAKRISSCASCSGDFRGVRADAGGVMLRLAANARHASSAENFVIMKGLPDSIQDARWVLPIRPNCERHVVQHALKAWLRLSKLTPCP